MTPEVGRALLSAVDVLDGLGLRYAVVGGLAVGAWGVNRSTRDADLYEPRAWNGAGRRGDGGASVSATGVDEGVERHP